MEELSGHHVSGPEPVGMGPAVVRRVPVRQLLVGIAAAGMAAWALVHTVSGLGSSPAPVELVSGTAMRAPSGSAGSSPLPGVGSVAPVPSPTLVVAHVVGEVRHPGLVRLAAGSRVADAIRAAGGLVAGGGSGALNLARTVGDGEQIVVSHDAPVAPPVSSNTGSGGAAVVDVVDLNTATASDLDALPGVGPVMAARILQWRAAHGRFAAIDQLREVSGIGAVTFERLKTHVRV